MEIYPYFPPVPLMACYGVIFMNVEHHYNMLTSLSVTFLQ